MTLVPLLCLELTTTSVDEVSEVLNGRCDLRDETLRSREERHQHRSPNLCLARHLREHFDALRVEELALVEATLDLKLGLVLGPLESDGGGRLRRLAGRPDHRRGAGH